MRFITLFAIAAFLTSCQKYGQFNIGQADFSNSGNRFNINTDMNGLIVAVFKNDNIDDKELCNPYNGKISLRLNSNGKKYIIDESNTQYTNWHQTKSIVLRFTKSEITLKRGDSIDVLVGNAKWGICDIYIDHYIK